MLIWILLPILIATVLLFSLFSSQKTKQNSKSTTLIEPINIQTSAKKIETSNPTPENIQVLGVEDIPENTKDFTFDTEKLYRLISEYRKEQDIHKLFVNKTLEESAQRKLSDMIENQYFRHADINKNESWYLFNASGYDYTFAGENLSSGYNTPWQVFDAWRLSAVHNEQLLKPEYLDMGLAVNCKVYEIKNQPACIVVLHLGAR